MKLHIFVLSAAALAVGAGAFAQTMSLHGSVDFTSYGAQQTRTTTDGESDHSDLAAGYDPDSNFTIDMQVSAANFEFNLGLYFTADGGDEEYFDFSNGGSHTPFYQGNMKISLFDSQLFFYTGKFEDFNAGYIENGYVLGTQSITNFADKDNGQHLTALEFAPAFVSGLKIFAGLPILPYYGNGIEEAFEANQWKNLGKKFKLAASYQLPINALDMTINAGWRPGTYYDGVDAWDADTSTGGTMATLTKGFTESVFGEGFIQFLLPDVIDGLSLNVSGDVRYRDAEYTTRELKTKEHTAIAAMFGISAEFGSLLLDDLTLALEDRFYFAGDDYIHSDEKFIYDILGIAAEYDIAGQPFSIGVNLAGMFAADALGTGFIEDSGAKVNHAHNFDGVGMSLNDMPTASTSGLTGKSTTYLGAYANPYIKFNFPNGALKIGAELSFTRFFNEDVTNTGLSYRIPVGITYSF